MTNDISKFAPPTQHATSTMLWIFPYLCGDGAYELWLGQLGQC